MSALRDDLLPSLRAIAEYKGESERRIRYLIARYSLPHRQIGRKIQSRKSWIDAYYAEPDGARVGAD
jgi:hypothetical protein